MIRTDVLVIGGGPAGLAAGIAARKKGFRVTVADGTKPPIDKACGEGLLPGTLAALRELGITIHAGHGQVFRGLRFVDATTSAEANFFGESGIGVRRTLLHQNLVEYAEDSGVDLLWNSPVSGLFHTGAFVGGRQIDAQWIIGADGVRSRVRHWSGLDAGSLRGVRFAQRRHYRVKPWTDFVEVHWGKDKQVYVTPLANEETCVVLISCDPRMRFEEALKEFPQIAENLSNAQLSSVERGATSALCRLSRVCSGNVALTGDASGGVDAITGEGLGLSFCQALALADALETGELKKYELAHRRLARRPTVMARLLLLLDRHAELRRRVLRGFARDPEVFSNVLALHANEASPRFIAETSVRFGWRLLTE
jgi:flavin-dependent dehydrogenase